MCTPSLTQLPDTEERAGQGMEQPHYDQNQHKQCRKCKNKNVMTIHPIAIKLKMRNNRCLT